MRNHAWLGALLTVATTIAAGAAGLAPMAPGGSFEDVVAWFESARGVSLAGATWTTLPTTAPTGTPLELVIGPDGATVRPLFSMRLAPTHAGCSMSSPLTTTVGWALAPLSTSCSLGAYQAHGFRIARTVLACAALQCSIDAYSTAPYGWMLAYCGPGVIASPGAGAGCAVVAGGAPVSALTSWDSTFLVNTGDGVGAHVA